jgi:ribosomal protein L16 Arg81 hydroxylase
LHDIEQILRSVEPLSPGVQLFDRGRISEGEFTRWTIADGVPRRYLDERFRTLLETGATLVLNSVEVHSVAARRLSEEVGQFSGFPACSNAYLSFGGEGSFGAHWDTHDVVVLQLVGRKHWRVGAPTFPLPLPTHTSRDSGQAAPRLSALDVLLEAGDVLYLPRGWWHEVTPLSEPSLHLSVGIYVPSVLDALGLLCQQLLPLELAARRGAIDEAATVRDLASLVEILRSALTNKALMSRLQGDLAVPDPLAREF